MGRGNEEKKKEGSRIKPERRRRRRPRTLNPYYWKRKKEGDKGRTDRSVATWGTGDRREKKRAKQDMIAPLPKRRAGRSKSNRKGARGWGWGGGKPQPRSHTWGSRNNSVFPNSRRCNSHRGTEGGGIEQKQKTPPELKEENTALIKLTSKRLVPT